MGRAASASMDWAPLLATVALVTWPLLPRFSSEVAVGAFLPATRAVPEHGAWQLWWVAESLKRGFAGFSDSPIFFPYAGTTYYSEPQVFLGVLLAPLWLLGASPTMVVNTGLFLTLLLNGVFVSRVARALEYTKPVATAAGMLALGLPFVQKDLNALNLVTISGLLWFLEGAVQFSKSGASRWAAWAGAGILAAFHGCMTYWIMFFPFFPLTILLMWRARAYTRDALMCIGFGIVPFLIPIMINAATIWRVHDALDTVRSLELVKALSAFPSDWVQRPHTSWLMVPSKQVGDTAGLFPGFCLLAMVLFGAVIGLRSKRAISWVVLWLCIASAGFLLSMGRRLTIWDLEPYLLLRGLLPGLDRIRAVYGYATIAYLAMPLLALPALATISRLGSRYGLRWSAPLFALVAVAENVPASMPTVSITSIDRQPWIGWLRRQEGDPVIVHVPFLLGGMSSYAGEELETGRMIQQIGHGVKMLNGYSGYRPRLVQAGKVVDDYGLFERMMARHFPSSRLSCYLKARGASLVVADTDWVSKVATSDLAHLRVVHADGSKTVFAFSSESCSR